MPSAKSGTAGTLVAPSAPDPAKDADKADPGEVEATKSEQRETQTGKYGSQDAKPFKPDKSGSDSDSSETSWIKIKLVDEEDHPVVGEPYSVKLPDGTFATGTTNEEGKAMVEGFAPGACEISFPKLDQSVIEEK